MRPRPVKRYRKPRYPTRLEVIARPDLLADHLPPAWLRRAELAGSVAFFLAVNGCGVSQDPKPQRTTEIPPDRGPVLQKAAVVAPIFEHGEGRGGIGCVAVSAPVFLSEEEALQLIGEELAREGIDVSRRDAEWDDVVLVEGTDRGSRADHSPARDRKRSVTERPLRVDIVDPKKGVAVEYVSESDYFEFGGIRSDSTWQPYSFPRVSSELAESVRRHREDVHFGVFYDPMTDLSDLRAADPSLRRMDWKERAAAGRTESRRLLRLQVRDFIDWLKGQGVL